MSLSLTSAELVSTLSFPAQNSQESSMTSMVRMRGSPWWSEVTLSELWSQSFVPRSQNLRLKQPKMVPTKQRKIFQAPDLKGVLQVFQGESSYVLWLPGGLSGWLGLHSLDRE